jgi:carbon-monoxide dehydrogenase medium subunit
MDISTVGVASVVSLQDRGRVCREARIALGAVAPTPIRAHSAEAMLKGQPVTPELLQRAAQEAQRLARPIDDVRASAAYRREIVGALALRTLERAVEMARGAEVPFEVQRRLAVQAAF